MRQGTGDRRQSHEVVDIWSTHSLRITMHVMGQRKKSKNKKNEVKNHVISYLRANLVVVCFLFQSVGCDNKLDSGFKYDHCAVCGGDSSTCTLVSGEYTLNWRKWGKIQSPAYCKKMPFLLKITYQTRAFPIRVPISSKS